MRTAGSNSGICARIARRVEESVGSRRFSMWFDQSARFDYSDHQRRVQVRVRNQFVADWIGRNFHEQLRQAVHTELGGEADYCVQIDTSVFDGAASGDTSPPVRIEGNGANSKNSRNGNGSDGRGHKKPMDRRRYCLEDFVVGPTNELAFAMANRLIDEESGMSRVMFVYGGCGLGKTHLLQGVCRRFQQLRATTGRCRYLTAEQFTNEFLAANRAGALDSFRRRIRKLELLAIDDVAFFAGKPATQREFLHTMDEVEMAGGRVLLSAHGHPRQLEGLEDKLVSRFLRGMVVEAQQPDTEMRARIVWNLAQQRGIPLMEAVVSVIASRCTGSVRELEGTLTKLHAMAHLTPGAGHGNGRSHSEGNGNGNGNGNGRSREIGHAMVERFFAAEREASPRRVVRFDAILTTVTEQLGVSRAQVLGGSRHRHVVLARSLVSQLTREMTSMSYPEIAAALGRKTHSTIISATRRIETKLTNHPNDPVTLPHTSETVKFIDLVDRVKRELRGG